MCDLVVGSWSADNWIKFVFGYFAHEQWINQLLELICADQCARHVLIGRESSTQFRPFLFGPGWNPVPIFLVMSTNFVNQFLYRIWLIDTSNLSSCPLSRSTPSLAVRTHAFIITRFWKQINKKSGFVWFCLNSVSYELLI